MARGWESKSVESQIDAAEDRRLLAERAHVKQEARDLEGNRQSIRLSIERVTRELAATNHPRRRDQLSAAIAFLEQQLATLQ